MLTLTLALAAAVSPLGVHVYTNDGAVQLVHVADADREPVEVCAQDVGVAADAEVTCAPVVVERQVLVARLDRPSSSTMRVQVKSTYQAWRGSTPAVVAVGLGGVSAICLASAAVLSATVVNAAGGAGGADVAGVVDAGGALGSTVAVLDSASTVMWISGAVAAVGAVAVGVVAVIDATAVE
jgi:hypothetical protein